MGGACSTYGGEEKFIQAWVGKPEVKRTLERPRHIWGDNIKMDLKLNVGARTGSSWLRIRTSGGHL